MNKLLFILLFFFPTISLAAGTVTGTAYDVAEYSEAKMYIYTSTDGVSQGADEVFKINTPGKFGRIAEIYFQSSSTNCDVWLSGLTGQTIGAATTYLSMTDINLSYSPQLEAPRFFLNRDTTPTADLYLTISEQSGTPTSTWTLVIVYLLNRL